MMAAAPLSGVRVLDFSWRIAGPYCTKLLADLGADVIKVEHPAGGDPAREMPPRHATAADPEASLLFLYLNAGKRSVVLDLGERRGRDAALELAASSDLIVESFSPGTLERLGLGWDMLRGLRSALTLTSISNFGQRGPLCDAPASELVLAATAGIMAISGSADREPLSQGLWQAQYSAGATAAWATMAALLEQEATGQGSWLDVSIRDAVAAEMVLNEPMYAWMGGIQGRVPAGVGGLNNLQRCRDGWIVLQVTKPRMWDELVELLEAPELLDERFATAAGRTRHARELNALLDARLADWDRRDLFAAASARRILVGMAQDPRDLLACEQLAARDYFSTIDHPSTGPLPHPGAAVQMSGADQRPTGRAPLLGEHTTDVLGEVLA